MSADGTNKVRFVHIPKTGGTTLLHILLREYRYREHARTYGIDYYYERDYANLSPEEQARVTFFWGHTPLVTGVQAIDEATTITMLRDPVERVKSFCQHVWEGKSPHLIDRFPPQQFRLEDFLNSDNQELYNRQTNFLTSPGEFKPASVLKQENDQELLEKALENLLAKVAIFGLADYFDESLMVFSTALHWQDLPVYTRSNAKDMRRALQFEEKHLDQIKELNSIDIQLYEYARSHFLEKFQNQYCDPEKLAEFRLINSEHQKSTSPLVQS